MVNDVTMIGNLTRDPELRYTQSGTAVCNLGLAVNTKYKSGDEWKENVLFIDVVVWGAQGEACSQYLAKGRQVYVSGRLDIRKWETDSGEKRSKPEIVASSVKFLGSKGDSGASAAPDDNSSIEPF